MNGINGGVGSDFKVGISDIGGASEGSCKYNLVAIGVSPEVGSLCRGERPLLQTGEHVVGEVFLTLQSQVDR